VAKANPTHSQASFLSQKLQEEALWIYPTSLTSSPSSQHCISTYPLSAPRCSVQNNVCGNYHILTFALLRSVSDYSDYSRDEYTRKQKAGFEHHHSHLPWVFCKTKEENQQSSAMLQSVGCRILQTFRRNILTPSSGWNSKSSKQSTVVLGNKTSWHTIFQVYNST
jgi:hypothetical protein